MVARLFLYLMLIITLPAGTLGSNKETTLLNEHLRILAAEFPPVSFKTIRNATGHIIRSDGVQKHMIEALSQMMNFSYSYLPIVTSSPDDSPSARGAISYLVNDEADYCMATSLATFYRLPKIDYPAAWHYGPFSTLLPYPKENINLAASFATLSYTVWILISVSFFVTILCLNMLQKNNTGEPSLRHREKDSAVLYVMGNLVSQGQRDFPNRLTIRIAAGAWCCTTFFLVQIYCCTLTSHLTAPNQKPIVNSFFKIADTPGVILTIDKGFALDQILRVVGDSSGDIKGFVDILKKENRLITCNSTSECLNYVKRGNAVYSSPINTIKFLMATDLQSTGTCHYTRTKETFWQVPVHSYLRKNSPYTEAMSRGTLRLQEAGLINEWFKWYTPSNSKCMKVNERNRMPRLSIKNLSSAFVILLTGYLIASVTFLTEKLIRFHRALRAEVV